MSENPQEPSTPNDQPEPPKDGELEQFSVLDEGEAAVHASGTEAPAGESAGEGIQTYTKAAAIEEIVANAPDLCGDAAAVRGEADRILQSYIDGGQIDPVLGFAPAQLGEARREVYQNLLGQFHPPEESAAVPEAGKQPGEAPAEEGEPVELAEVAGEPAGAPPEGADITDVVEQTHSPPSDPEDEFEDVTAEPEPEYKEIRIPELRPREEAEKEIFDKVMQRRITRLSPKYRNGENEREEIERSVCFVVSNYLKGRADKAYINMNAFDNLAECVYQDIVSQDIINRTEKRTSKAAWAILGVGVAMFAAGVGAVHLGEYLLDDEGAGEQKQEKQAEISEDYRQNFQTQKNQLVVPASVDDIVILGDNVTPEEIHARGYFLDGSFTQKIKGKDGKERQNALADLHARALAETNKRCAEAYQIVVENQDAKVRIYKVK
ncbi:hypothetical protein JW707_00735 [Candidatus Woesearchaeota archaeon]|nr:hypothetical protein [Candidatus Woesearchaeota archaeon]